VTVFDIPPPGSEAALDLGCLCAVWDNAHGRGYFGNSDRFVITMGCPLHDATQAQIRHNTGANQVDEEIWHGDATN